MEAHGTTLPPAPPPGTIVLPVHRGDVMRKEKCFSARADMLPLAPPSIRCEARASGAPCCSLALKPCGGKPRAQRIDLLVYFVPAHLPHRTLQESPAPRATAVCYSFARARASPKPKSDQSSARVRLFVSVSAARPRHGLASNYLFWLG